MSAELTQAKALIFRITHRKNMAWAIQHGLHCSTSNKIDPNFINIGNEDLISKRTTRTIPPNHQSTLADYVPFYFTPYSPMMLNIVTGRGGVTKRHGRFLVIIVTSLHRLKEKNIDFLFTDRHANLNTAKFYSNIQDLGNVDWALLQKRDFRNDPDDPGKMRRYMAEALVRKHVPTDAFHGIACYDNESKAMMSEAMDQCGVQLKVVVKPGWYF